MQTLAAKQSPHHPPARTPATVTSGPVPGPDPLSSSPGYLPVLQRKPGCACGGGCPDCQEEAAIQPKLRVGQPNDKYEQEADRVAEQVMRMPEPAVQRQPT